MIQYTVFELFELVHKVKTGDIDNDGIGHINLMDFLLHPKAIEEL